jgi:hypothetical protein
MAEADSEGARPNDLVRQAGRAGEEKQGVKERDGCAPIAQAKMPLTTSP